MRWGDAQRVSNKLTSYNFVRHLQEHIVGIFRKSTFVRRTLKLQKGNM